MAVAMIFSTFSGVLLVIFILNAHHLNQYSTGLENLISTERTFTKSLTKRSEVVHRRCAVVRATFDAGKLLDIVKHCKDFRAI